MRATAFETASLPVWPRTASSTLYSWGCVSEPRRMPTRHWSRPASEDTRAHTCWTILRTYDAGTHADNPYVSMHTIQNIR